MRKLVSMILALLLCLSLTASAELTDVPVLRLSDPSVRLDGEEILNFDGLSVQFALGKDEAQFLTQLFADLLVDNETIQSLMVQAEPSGISGILSGMSGAYGFPLPEAKDDGRADAVVNDLLGAVMTAAGGILNIKESIQNSEGEAEVRVGASGEELNFRSFSQDITEPLWNVAEEMLNNPTVSAFLDMTGTSVNLPENDGSIAVTVEGEVGTDAFDQIREADMIVRFSEDDTEELTADISGWTKDGEGVFEMVFREGNEEQMRLSAESVMTEETMSAKLAITIPSAYIESTETVTLALNGEKTDNGVQLLLTLDDAYGDDVDNLLTAKGQYTQSDAGEDLDVTAEMADVEDTMHLHIWGQGDQVKGEMYIGEDISASPSYMTFSCDSASGVCDFTAFIDGVEITASYQPDAAPAQGAVRSGKASLCVDVDGTVLECALNISEMNAAIDMDMLRIRSFIDLTSLTDEQSDAASSELMDVLDSLLGTLSGRFEAVSLIESFFSEE